ncbi:solute carrier family 22 member 4-like isoform X1 [Neocloeon triangulifer]|uniref:solute carrier family 22 member 4-like isoform X1 n=1 Tax=Neocloeon triangulifer TaxID=2078957 RepID=UPI00286EEA2A|nr:solute carrier family 22 member 4-like isoform X1 [Neocloeon triangulifer]XP_059480580.1 solute carrier family 22 member 4-like isoform X1 [Neocloeon triangulifer]
MGVNEDFDSMLNEIGGCGLYQIRQNLLVGLAIAFSAVSTIGFVFTAARVPHRCQVEVCGDQGEMSSPFLPEWLHEAVPIEPSGEPALCVIYQNLNISTNSCSFDQRSEKRCSSWVYKSRERTIQTEFSLTCPENEWKLAMVGTLHNIGNMIGLPISGFLSDRYGRKSALVFSLIANSIFGLLKSTANSFEIFLILETVEPIFGGNIYGISFILALELVTPKKRVLGCMVIAVAFAFGSALVGAVAWVLQDWRTFLWVTNGPALLFISYIWLLPESVRWLLARGKLGDAKKVVQFAAKLNRAELGEERMKDWENDQIDRVYTEEAEKDDSLWPALRKVTKSRILLARLAVCSVCWASANLVFFGMSLNSVSLAGTDNKYLNFILSSVVEAPSYLITWLCMNRLGRRKAQLLTFVASGITCFAITFLPKNGKIIRLILYLVGKFAITCAFDTALVFTAEIFPTNLRNSLLGLCSMMGRVGSVVAPQTPLMAQYYNISPLTLFGTVALIAGTLALFLPESKGLPLPASVKEAEDLSRQRQNQKASHNNDLEATTALNKLALMDN